MRVPTVDRALHPADMGVPIRVGGKVSQHAPHRVEWRANLDCAANRARRAQVQVVATPQGFRRISRHLSAESQRSNFTGLCGSRMRSRTVAQTREADLDLAVH